MALNLSNKEIRVYTLMWPYD